MLRQFFKSTNYQDPDLVDVIFAKTAALDEKALSDFPPSAGLDQTVLGVSYAASLIPNRPMRVLDFGGACGFHHRVAGVAAPHIKTKWAVVETPAMAKRATELATDSIRFFHRISDAVSWLGGVDLMYSSGTLQCVAEPESTLRDLCSVGATVLIWTRLALSTGDRVKVTQTSMLSENGPGPMPAGFVDRPVNFSRIEIPVSDFLETHRRENYHQAWKFSGDSVGFLFSKRPA